MNDKCERAGRTRPLKYVTRFQIFARESEEEAFEAAEEVMSRVDPEVLAHRGKVISSFESQGTKDQQARTREEMVAPNLWAGMGRIRSGSAPSPSWAPMNNARRKLSRSNRRASTCLSSRASPCMRNAKP